MKKLILPMLVFILIGLIGVVSACITFPEFKSKTCNFSYNVHNESEIITLLNNKTAECSFSSVDFGILKDFLTNGYTVREQTDEEYASFLEQVIIDNEKEGCAFAKYKAIFHKGKWTGTINDASVDESGEGCPVPTCGIMASILPNIVWNDLNDCMVDSDCFPSGFVPSNCGTFYSCINNKCAVGSNSCDDENNGCKNLFYFIKT